MAIGQELLNVPMGDMIQQMASAIADAQYELDANSINVAEMMGGLTTVYDEKGKVSFDDSRVFFGYDYMSVSEAEDYAKIDDVMSGEGSVKLKDILTEIKKGKDVNGDTVSSTSQIRVPTRVSMMELGFTPTFYQFVDTIIEVRIAIKITRSRERIINRKRDTEVKEKKYSLYRRRRRYGIRTRKNVVTTSQVDATYSSKYSYSAEGASLLRTKLTPVPPPAVLEERIRSMMEHEEQRRAARLAEDTQKPTGG